MLLVSNPLWLEISPKGEYVRLLNKREKEGQRFTGKVSQSTEVGWNSVWVEGKRDYPFRISLEIDNSLKKKQLSLYIQDKVKRTRRHWTQWGQS